MKHSLLIWIVVGVLQCVASDAWQDAGYPGRVVFDVPENAEGAVVVDLDVPWQSEGGISAFNGDGDPVFSRLLDSPPDRLQAVVYVTGKERTGYVLYFGNPEETVDVEVAVVKPVTVTSYYLRGNSPPASLERFRYMLHMAQPEKGTSYHAAFGALTAGAQPPEKSRHYHPRLMLHRVTTYFSLPEIGLYRFGMESSHGGCMLINGNPVVEDYSAYRREGTVVGAAVELSEGLHRLDVLICAPPTFSVIPSWTAQGEGESLRRIDDDIMVAGERARNARVERRDADTHAHFDAEIIEAVRFSGDEDIFVHVKFTNRSVTHADSSIRYRWVFSDGDQSGEEHAEHVFKAGSIYDITLSAKDEQGVQSESRRMLDLTSVVPLDADYRIDIPPYAVALAPRDLLRLTLKPRLAGGDMISGIDIAWRIHMTNGNIIEGLSEQNIQDESWQIDLPELPAKNVSHISWALRFNGVAVRNEAIRVVDPAQIPSDCTWRGSLIDTAGTYYIVMTSLDARSASSIPLPAGNWLIFSDSLFAGMQRNVRNLFTEQLVAGGIAPEDAVFHFINLFNGDAAAASVSLLACIPKLLSHMDAHNGGGPVILALGQDALLGGANSADMERDALVLSAIVQARTGYAPLWVIPPPIEGHSAQSRELAHMLMRVADRNGSRTADLYSAAQTSRDRAIRMGDGRVELSGYGAQLTGELIARALKGWR